jgi:sugar fermentation stimulation protein A
MNFENPLVEGTIINRYKRFLADIKLSDNETITAHVANTGSMTGCWEPSWPVLLSRHDNTKRKYPFSLEMTFNGKSWIGVNTSRTNKLAVEAIKSGKINQLANFDQLETEVKTGDSRLDILLIQELIKHFIEVKNVTLKNNNGNASFPDSVTKRGQKHIKELISLVEQGHKATLLFIIQREDIINFSPAKEIDPEYASLLHQANEKGVNILAYKCKLNNKGITVDQQVQCLL